MKANLYWISNALCVNRLISSVLLKSSFDIQETSSTLYLKVTSKASARWRFSLTPTNTVCNIDCPPVNTPSFLLIYDYMEAKERDIHTFPFSLSLACDNWELERTWSRLGNKHTSNHHHAITRNILTKTCKPHSFFFFLRKGNFIN